MCKIQKVCLYLMTNKQAGCCVTLFNSNYLVQIAEMKSNHKFALFGSIHPKDYFRKITKAHQIHSSSNYTLFCRQDSCSLYNSFNILFKSLIILILIVLFYSIIMQFPSFSLKRWTLFNIDYIKIYKRNCGII